MNNTTKETPGASITGQINTLEDIAEYKAKIKEQIRMDEKSIGDKWHSLFNNEECKTSNRWMSLLNTGMGVLDGAILGWKLYRQFKRNPILKKFK